LRDLTFIEDGNLDWIDEAAGEDKQINVAKLRMVGQVLLEFVGHQSLRINELFLRACSSTKVRGLQDEIGSRQVPEHADDILYELSLAILPTKQPAV
jgi:hypothetical protein